MKQDKASGVESLASSRVGKIKHACHTYEECFYRIQFFYNNLPNAESDKKITKQ